MRTAARPAARLRVLQDAFAGNARSPALLRSEPPVSAQESADVARLLNAGCAILAGSVLADSSMEHYRGSFENKAMFVPPIVSTLALAASLHGASDRSARAERRRDAIYALSAAAAAAGFGF